MRILILGGTGALGSRVGARLRAAGHGVAVTGREVDVTDVAAVTGHARHHDVVISLAPVPAGFVQLACARAGVPSVDAAARVNQDLLEQADAEATTKSTAHVVGVGLIPGLSGLLVHEVAAAVPGRRLAVVLEQSSNAWVGPAGVREMLRMVQPGPGIRRGAEVLLRLDHPEAATLARTGVAAEYFTRWESGGQTRATSALAALGLLPAVTRLPDRWLRGLASHRPDLGEEATLTVRAAGARLGASAEVRSDYEATAAVLAAVAVRAPRLTPGVLRLWEAVELSAIAEEISDVATLRGLGLPPGAAAED